MICTSVGSDVGDLLARVAHAPHAYKECIICAPFVDQVTACTLADLLVRTARSSCGMHVMTTPPALRVIEAFLPAPVSVWKRSLTALRELHAKVYLARGRKPAISEAIVTSANLTEAGLTQNIELGVHIRSTTAPGRALLDHILAFMRRIRRNGV